MNSAAVARNAPCPCGSGKRYKDCHGMVARTGEPLAPDELLRRAGVAAAAGQWSAAGELLAAAIALSPERADLLRERARVEWRRGDLTAAVATCRAALARAPGDGAAWNLLGEILQASDAPAAERAWHEAVRLHPDDPEALFHLGNRARERGELDTAIGHYERALGRTPGHAGMLNNLGLAWAARGEHERAEARYREALLAQPTHADALANLAALLQRQQRYREAVPVFEQALSMRRDFSADFWNACGISQGEVGALAEAEASFREAARLAPDRVQIQVDLAYTCMGQSKFEAAEVALARAAELAPGHAYVATLLAFSRLQSCAWDGLEALFATVRRCVADEATPAAYAVAPFPLLAMPLGPWVELAAARRWAQRIAASGAAELLPPATRTPRAAGRLRVGYVSSDLREHPVARLLVECWERTDRTRIETFAYSLAPEDPGAFGQRVARAFEHFVDVSSAPPAPVAQRIRADGIDVLVDLNGYTTHARSELFALRPAPVQVSWLGYLGTLGAPWYDYVLTDRFATPPAQQAFFTERLLYLPDCYCPSDTRRPVASAVGARTACGLPASGFVFCCFNNTYKILPAVFAVWMRLLAALPDSVLWLAPGQARACANLRREASARGVDPARLIFAPRVSLAEHLARHGHADLFLDTTPYNAGATANDALFMGVPVLTCAGDTMASRVAGSQLCALGLPELITASLDAYEALALTLAREPAQLQRLRARLAANRHTHPLFDMARFARALDDLLLAAWENRPSPRT